MKKTINIYEHLLSRDVDFDLDKLYINTETNTATFPLYNLSGQWTGYQHYNPTGPKGNRSENKKYNVRDLKYHSRITKINNIPMLSVYGLDKFDHTCPYLFIVEGIFDCIKLHRLGLNAIAVLANVGIRLETWLNTLSQVIIVITDNDDNKAGDMLSEYGDLSFTVPSPYNDLGDMQLEEIKRFINSIGIKL